MKVIKTGGVEVELGTVEAASTISMTDYSRRETDDFGVTSVVKRGFARKMALRLAMPFDDVARVQRELALLRGAAARWQADADIDWLNFDGFYKEFALDLAVPPLSYCSLTVEGLAETEVGVDDGSDPASEGASTLVVVQPLAITDAVLVASNVPENDYAAWSNLVSYPKAARVIKTATHRIYESAANANLAHDPQAETGHWFDIGPTNRWAMFDQALGSITSSSGNITLTLAAGAVDAVALLDVIATSVRVQTTGYDQTKSASSGAVSFLDLPGVVANLIVTITGTGTVSVGTLLAGTLAGLGITGESPSAGITDFSRKDTDDFGTVTIIERAWAKRMSIKSLIKTSAIDILANRIAALRGAPAYWIGDDGADVLSIYGFFKDFQIEVGETVSTLSLSVEGLSKAASVNSLLADDDPYILRPSEKRALIISEAARTANIDVLVASGVANGQTNLVTALVTAQSQWTAYRDSLFPAWDDLTAISLRDWVLWHNLNATLDTAIAAMLSSQRPVTYYQDLPPGADETQPQQRWVDTSDNRHEYLRGPDGIAIGGEVYTIEGVHYTIPWFDVGDHAADNTIANVPLLDYSPPRVINCTDGGAPFDGQFPDRSSIRVLRNGVSIKSADGTDYQIRTSTNLIDAVVNNVTGSSGKGDWSVGGISANTGLLEIEVRVDGNLIGIASIPFRKSSPVQVVTGGGGVKSASVGPNATVNSTTDTVITPVFKMAVLTGESIRCAASLDYTIDGEGGEVRTATVTPQYSADGTTGWTPLVSGVVGSATTAGQNVYNPALDDSSWQEPMAGHVDINQTKAGLAAAGWFVRVVAGLNASGRTAAFTGPINWSVS